MENSYVFDIYEKMFEMPAWKDLVEDLKRRQEDLPKHLLFNPQATEKELYRAQGLSAAYGYIIGLEQSMENAKKQIEEDKELPSVETTSI